LSFLSQLAAGKSAPRDDKGEGLVPWKVVAGPKAIFSTSGGENAFGVRNHSPWRMTNGWDSWYIFIGQTDEGDDRHGGIPTAANPPLSFPGRSGAAHRAWARHRRIGPTWKAGSEDPVGNPVESIHLCPVQPPAAWEIPSPTAVASPAPATSAGFVASSRSPGWHASHLIPTCRSHPDGTPSDEWTSNPSAPFRPAKAPIFVTIYFADRRRCSEFSRYFAG
jgi:hypothetical protein